MFLGTLLVVQGEIVFSQLFSRVEGTMKMFEDSSNMIPPNYACKCSEKDVEMLDPIKIIIRYVLAYIKIQPVRAYNFLHHYSLNHLWNAL